MTIKTAVPHTNSVLCAGLCFVWLPLYKHLWLSLSSLIDWFISALMLEIESTLLSAAKDAGTRQVHRLYPLFAPVCVSHFHHACVKVHRLQLEGECKKKKKDKLRLFLSRSPSFFLHPPRLTQKPILSTPLFQCAVAPPSLILLGEHGSMQWKKLSQ